MGRAVEPVPLQTEMHTTVLHRSAILLAVCTLLLVVAGAFVTSQSTSDWPLHRTAGTAVGLLTVVFAILVFRFETRRWMRTLSLSLIAIAGVVLQGALGALNVIFVLPKFVGIVHACLAQVFFCTTAAMTVFTSKSWLRGPEYVQDHGWPSLRSLSVATCVLILGQVALGAAFRHKAAGVMPHVLGATIVMGAILILGIFVLSQFPNHPTLRQSALALIFITFLQVFLGIAAYMTRISIAGDAQPPWETAGLAVAHVAVGALTFGAAVILSIQVFRNVRPRSAVQLTSQSVIAG